MYDLLHLSGTLKGNVGEEIYVHINKYAHRTRFDSYYWLNKLNFEIPFWMKNYLIKNWTTIDAFEFIVEGDKVKNIIFYEIKTTRYNTLRLPLTHNSKNFYLKSKELGFIVKSVYVFLKKNWKFEIFEKDFNLNNYVVHSGNPKYSKKTILS